MHSIGIGEQKKSTINQLLSGSAYYIVPIFQREFSWNKDEWSDLAEDIERAITNEAQHFFGFMMIKPDKANNILIIEGQQRLATITIIASVIIDLLYEMKTEKHKDIQKEYIKSGDLFSENPKQRYKLSLSNINNDFLRKYVQSEDVPSKKFHKYKQELKMHPSNKLMFDCYKYYHKLLSDKISDLTEDMKTKYLLKYLGTTLNNLLVIVTEVFDNKTAYNVYKTLNDRGLDLALADLLKVHLFQIVEDDVDAAKSKWDEMTSSLGTINLNLFLKHYWLSRYGVVNEKYLMDELEKKIKTDQQVFEFLEALKIEAEYYESIFNRRIDVWGSEKAKLIDQLFVLSRDMVMPILLSALQILKDTSHASFLKYCIAVVFRYLTIGERESKEMINVFSQIAIDIRNLKLKNLKEIRDRFRPLYVDDETFKSNFLTKEIKTAKVARYILEGIELSIHPEIQEFTEKITLEHILPKNPNDKWREYIKVNDFEFESVIDRLGNMTLLVGKYNKDAQNKFFTVKRDEYYSKMTRLKINEPLKDINSWSLADIEIRQTWFANKAIDIWKL